MYLIDFPTKRKLPTRSSPIRAVVLHTTGETDLDKILDFYTSPTGFQPHYLIETHGTVRRTAAETLVAYHAAHHAAERAAYERGFSYWSNIDWDEKKNAPVNYGKFFPGYTVWNTRWRSQGLESPLDLITGGSPNSVSIGIELQQPDYPTPTIFTEEQYQALDELLADVTARHRIPRDRKHILGHYDVGPMRRTTAKTPGGWDPGGKFNWDRALHVISPT